MCSPQLGDLPSADIRSLESLIRSCPAALRTTAPQAAEAFVGADVAICGAGPDMAWPSARS